MICFRDMTFCASDCINTQCRRHFCEVDMMQARAWWRHDPENAPIAWSDFSKGCTEYAKPNT